MIAGTGSPPAKLVVALKYLPVMKHLQSPWLPAVMAALLGISIPAHADTKPQPSPTPVDLSQFQITPRLRGAPIPCGPDARLEDDVSKLHYQWLARVLVPHLSPDKDPQHAAFIKATLDASVPRDKVHAMAHAIDTSKITDPGLLYIIGWSLPDGDPASKPLFQRSLALFPQSAYPKFFSFVTALDVDGASPRAMGRKRRKLDNNALSYLTPALSEGCFQPAELPILREYFENDSFQHLLTRRSADVVAAFNAGTDVQPWLKDYVAGTDYINQAWNARGDDWAANVTAQGWTGFAKGLSQARECLVRSWNENPHDPGAAAAMITVCMGEGEQTDTMRLWFDRSVAAQFDFPAAYDNMELGLYPRWGGSYAEMNAWGNECAATNRYDTIVPERRITVGCDITADSHDKGAQFNDPKVATEMVTVVDNYLAQKDDPLTDMRFLHTLAAIMDNKLGRKAAALKHMAAIGSNPDNGLWYLHGDMRKLAREARPPAPGASPGAVQDQKNPEPPVGPSPSPAKNPPSNGPDNTQTPG